MPLVGAELAEFLTAEGADVRVYTERDGHAGFVVRAEATRAGRTVVFEPDRLYEDAEVRGLMAQLGIPADDVPEDDDGDEGTLYEFSASIDAEVEELPHGSDEDADVYIILGKDDATHWTGDGHSRLSRADATRISSELRTPLPGGATRESGPGVALDSLVQQLAQAHGASMSFTHDAANERLLVTSTVLGGPRTQAVSYHASGGQDTLTSAETARLCSLLGVGVPPELEHYRPSNAFTVMTGSDNDAQAPMAVAAWEATGHDSDASTEVDLNDASTETVEEHYVNRGQDADGHAIEKSFEEQEADELSEEADDPGHVN